MTSVAPVNDARLPLPLTKRQRPRLSILVLSRTDESGLERALRLVGDAADSMGAQVVLVREEATGSERERVERMVQRYQCALAWVGVGSDRSAMTDEGLKYATGDIVTCRDDDRIHDGEWLSVFSRFGSPLPRRATDLDVTTGPSDDRVPSAGRSADRPSRVAYSSRRWVETASESAR